MKAITAKRPSLLSYRIGRPAYWIGIAFVVLATIGLGFVVKSGAAGGAGVVWALLYTWRLHDFGKSGWWAAAAIGAIFAAALVPLVIGAVVVGADRPAFGVVAGLGIGLAILLQLVFTIWIGAVRGDPGENRYGLRTEYKVGRFTL